MHHQFGKRTMHGGSQNLRVVLYHDSVMEHGYESGYIDLAVLESRRAVHDVILLPLPRRPACIDQRRRLAVDRCSLAIGVSEIVEAIQHLHLVESQQEYAAVPALLAIAFGRRWSTPLDVKLAIAEFAARKNVATARQHLHISIPYSPFRGLSLFRAPGGETSTVE